MIIQSTTNPAKQSAKLSVRGKLINVRTVRKNSARSISITHNNGRTTRLIRSGLWCFGYWSRIHDSGLEKSIDEKEVEIIYRYWMDGLIELPEGMFNE